MSGTVNFEKKHLVQCKYFSAFRRRGPRTRPHAVAGRTTESCYPLCVVPSVAGKQPVDVLRFDLKAVPDDRQILQSHCSPGCHDRDDKYARTRQSGTKDRRVDLPIFIAIAISRIDRSSLRKIPNFPQREYSRFLFHRLFRYRALKFNANRKAEISREIRLIFVTSLYYAVIISSAKACSLIFAVSNSR